MAQRKPKRLPTFLADREPEALLRGTTRQRDRLLGLTMLYAGPRVSELCHLQVEDMDFARGWLFVREGKGRKDRVLPLSRKIAGPLRGWIGARTTGPVFESSHGGELTPRAVQLMVKRWALAAGLMRAKEVRRFTPHKFPARLRQPASALGRNHPGGQGTPRALQPGNNQHLSPFGAGTSVGRHQPNLRV